MTEPSAAQRRALLAQARTLKARLTIGRGGLSDALVAQVRQALTKVPLLKVRIGGGDREFVDQTARELAERVPCLLLGRIGFVAILYRKQASSSLPPE